MMDLNELSATAVVAAITSNDCTAEEVTRACLARIEERELRIGEREVRIEECEERIKEGEARIEEREGRVEERVARIEGRIEGRGSPD